MRGGGGAPGWVWTAALGCLALAASTGLLFRAGVLTALPWGLLLPDVRHAHSHLMFFGWVTPALMALLSSRREGSWRGGAAVFGAVVALALASWPLFLRWGYRSAEVGSARLPLSVMVSGLSMVAWYAWLVWDARRGRGQGGVAEALDRLARVYLGLSTAAAWGIAAAQAAPWLGAETLRLLPHAFVEWFTRGWLVLGVLALLFDAARHRHAAPRWAEVAALVVGLAAPWSVLATLPGGARWGWAWWVSEAALVVGGAALVVVAVGLWRGGVWRLGSGLGGAALLCAGIKGATEVALGLAPAAWAEAWLGDLTLKVVYLHVVLVGFVSVVLMLAARRAWGAAATPGLGALASAWALVIGTLLPISSLWPVALAGAWAPRSAVAMAAMATGAAWWMFGARVVSGWRRRV